MHFRTIQKFGDRGIENRIARGFTGARRRRRVRTVYVIMLATRCGAKATGTGANVERMSIRVDLMHEGYKGRFSAEAWLVSVLLSVLCMTMKKVIFETEVFYQLPCSF